MPPQPIPVRIAGLGHYLPERIVTSSELEEKYNLAPGWIETVAGVRQRRYADRETTASMAAAAARQALDAAGLQAKDLDAIIGACTGPQQAIPCTAALVQAELGAPEGASACFDVNATCLSFLFALHNAALLIANGAYQRVLIFSSEIASISLNPDEPESAVLFGDGAAAAVLTRSPARDSAALWHTRFATYSGGADLTRILGGGTLHHPNHPATTRQMNQFHMDGPAVFKKAARLVTPFLDQFFTELGWQRSDLQAIVPHQASGHAVRLVAARMGFAEERVFSNIALRGNCVAASIPLALSEAAQANFIQRGQRLLLLGSGAGLTLGAMALTY